MRAFTHKTSDMIDFFQFFTDFMVRGTVSPFGHFSRVLRSDLQAHQWTEQRIEWMLSNFPEFTDRYFKK